MSLIRTARQHNVDPIELMVSAQQSGAPAASNRIKLSARASPTSLAA
jgi:hypothetical protein